jgi:hypothetical protein
MAVAPLDVARRRGTMMQAGPVRCDDPLGSGISPTARDKRLDSSPRFLPIDLAQQRLPGTLARGAPPADAPTRQ